MATTSYEIRSAHRDDLPAIVGIYNWAVNQTFATIDSEPLDVEEAQSWWQDHASRSAMIVACDDTGVVAWGRLLPWKQRGFDVVEDFVYVDPVHQGRGLGRLLLSRLLEIAAQTDSWRTMVATVAADNRAGLRLHLSLGFEVVGTIESGAYKFDRWMDITLVQRPIRA